MLHCFQEHQYDGWNVWKQFCGERTLKYGKTEDYILEAKVVFGDGNEYIVKPLNKNELEKKIAQEDYEGNVIKIF